ncbi:hypothetical protein [Plantactinospora soyae]|uniref:Uncharacterized protein n=1 Tax=Plantactinospora soyae TaxID=1544732 RepID=A0A927R287_9ACTN|nr:hypothetical protein [Plantactinospora soyae]MBE1492272.1 hypothetical protein [Plantactinospora soyae]
MSALSGTAYASYARTRIAEARAAVVRHAVCAYTGVCLGCGRPGPCPTLAAARRTLAHHTHRSTNQRAHTYGYRQFPMMSGDVTNGVSPAELRAACLAVGAAVDPAHRQLAGVDRPQPQAEQAHWGDALTDAWQALGMLYSRISEARRPPGNAPTSVRHVLVGLAAARADAERAGAVVGRVRRQVAAAEDRVRRAGADPSVRVAADRGRTTHARLDLVAARLAIGVRTIDRYADALSGAIQSRRPRATSTIDAESIAAGATTAGAVLLTVHPQTGWRGFLARLRHGHPLVRRRTGLC